MRYQNLQKLGKKLKRWAPLISKYVKVFDFADKIVAQAEGWKALFNCHKNILFLKYTISEFRHVNTTKSVQGQIVPKKHTGCPGRTSLGIRKGTANKSSEQLLLAFGSREIKFSSGPILEFFRLE